MATAQGPAGGSSSSGPHGPSSVPASAPAAGPGADGPALEGPGPDGIVLDGPHPDGPVLDGTPDHDLLIDERRRGLAARSVPRLAPVVPILLGAWLILSSAPVGGPGARAVVWFAALAVPLAVLLWIGAGLMIADARRYASRAARPVTAWITATCWSCVLVLGLFLPDLVDGRPTSIFLALAPSATPGLSWGFANTVGVLSFAAAAAGVVSVAVDVRRTRRLRRGEALTVDPDEEDRQREAWLASFRDPEHHAS